MRSERLLQLQLLRAERRLQPYSASLRTACCTVQPLCVACGDLRHVLQPTDALLRGVFALLEDRPSDTSHADAAADALLDACGGGGAQQRKALVRVELLVQFLQGGARSLPWPDRTRWVADPRLKYFDAAADCYGVVREHSPLCSQCRSLCVHRQHWLKASYAATDPSKGNAAQEGMQRASLHASLQLGYSGCSHRFHIVGHSCVTGGAEPDGALGSRRGRTRGTLQRALHVEAAMLRACLGDGICNGFSNWRAFICCRRAASIDRARGRRMHTS